MRAWPLLALLILVLVAGIGCVLWFMREAMANEHAAVRQRLADAYRGHLELVQGRMEALLLSQISTLDTIPSTPEGFAQWAGKGEVASLIVMDPEGGTIYPRAAAPQPSKGAETSPPARITEAESVQTAARNLIQTGDLAAAVRLVSERFTDTDLGGTLDANGRLTSANAELLVLEAAATNEDPALAFITMRLVDRVNDYRSPLSSAQRRFLIRELLRLTGTPPDTFPTWPAENLAAQYLESGVKRPSPLSLERTPLPEIWHVLSQDQRVLALLSSSQLHQLLAKAVKQTSAPEGVRPIENDGVMAATRSPTPAAD
ncbi:MAG: hypothetical protein EOP84_29960, partial [Verrucomicrobiaceae bacterium]